MRFRRIAGEVCPPATWAMAGDGLTSLVSLVY